MPYELFATDVSLPPDANWIDVVKAFGPASLAAAAVWWLTGKHEKVVDKITSSHESALTNLADAQEKRDTAYVELTNKQIVAFVELSKELTEGRREAKELAVGHDKRYEDIIRRLESIEKRLLFDKATLSVLPALTN